MFRRPKKIKHHLKFFHDEVFKTEEEKNLLNYYENYWVNKKIKLFNYYNLMNDVETLKNAYITKKGNKSSEKDIISKIKSLEKVFLTNNICESIHSHISKFIENKSVSKSLLKLLIILSIIINII